MFHFMKIGDYVIIVNADKAMLTGNKRQNKLYYRHSGYLGGLKWDNYETLVARKPTALWKKPFGVCSRGPHWENKLYSNVKIYAGEAHPHEAQQPEALEL
jgi:large subunit ribosomal protein L13